ncbi:MAG TPA: 30S ribosome-binding factor RbfA [Thermoanaerobaculia bacterium]|nr:30S ribosome-binding factor RbfA [Thermoanaerobaculia bacterium]
MKKTRRTSRVGESVRDALVEVFRHDLKDVKIGFTSITGVDVSPDLHFARVFISGLTPDETRAVVDALQNARGAVRHYLGKRIRLRYTPELDFKYDEAPERGGRIEALLAGMKPKEEPDDDGTES